ncbi:MAG TPA: hypothetical protein VLN45_04375 [Ignavibacteriaceae bacterium]|nr:hypothetical protein [Ignavibacteriaceae bacterium]
MKRMIIIAAFVLFGFLSCSTQVDEFLDDGVITGVDIRECACCGGYFIDIEDNTYRFYELPANSNIDLSNADFPIHVKIYWKVDETCLGDEIKVLSIEKK